MRLGTKQHLFLRKNEKDKAKKFLIFTSVIVLFMVLVIYIFGVFRPAFLSYAENQAKQIAIFAINNAVSGKLSSEKIDYRDIVEFERDNENNINAVNSNISGISKIKSDLSIEITEKIAKLPKQTLKIPVGSLLGSDFFAGVGPDISFDIKPYGIAMCDVQTDFTESGINQTKLDVTVNVDANVSVLMPTVRRAAKVKTSVPIISTVIVGKVPESFTHVDRDGYAFENDVMDLAN